MQKRREHHDRIPAVVGVVIFTLLACEPVIAIGWKEILFVFFLMAFLFGPPVYRFIRKIEKYRRREEQDK